MGAHIYDVIHVIYLTSSISEGTISECTGQNQASVHGGGGGGGDRVPSCRHRAGGVGQFLAGMQFSTKVLKCVVNGHLLKFLETS